jgi:hypothetical protein
MAALVLAVRDSEGGPVLVTSLRPLGARTHLALQNLSTCYVADAMPIAPAVQVAVFLGCSVAFHQEGI